MTRRRFTNDPPKGKIAAGETVDVDRAAACNGGPAEITGGSNHVLDTQTQVDTAHRGRGSERKVKCLSRPGVPMM